MLVFILLLVLSELKLNFLIMLSHALLKENLFIIIINKTTKTSAKVCRAENWTFVCRELSSS